MPPLFCASAMTCRAMVVLPEDSGPKISTTRPRGKPPTPRAASKEMAPVEITEIGTIASLLPRRMIDPLPNCFSICDNARSIARDFSSAMPGAPYKEKTWQINANVCGKPKNVREICVFLPILDRREIVHGFQVIGE